MQWIRSTGRTFGRLLGDESGPSATEYAILLALLVLIAVSAIRAIGASMMGIYDAINSSVP